MLIFKFYGAKFSIDYLLNLMLDNIWLKALAVLDYYYYKNSRLIFNNYFRYLNLILNTIEHVLQTEK